MLHAEAHIKQNDREQTNLLHTQRTWNENAFASECECVCVYVCGKVEKSQPHINRNKQNDTKQRGISFCLLDFSVSIFSVVPLDWFAQSDVGI